MNGIRFETVSKSYDDQVVLDRFSMSVETAEMKIILGGSGSGKSTILKMVLGLIRPDSGSITVSDQSINELDEEELMPLRSKIGMVFQEGALFDSLTVAENVCYRLREQKSGTEEEIRAITEEVLGFVGLGDAIDRMPSELSGGMKRRVAIARALVGNPSIMLYDEPTAGLDPITSRTICELVMRLRDLEQVTTIFVTHDLKSAMTMASEKAFREENGEVQFRRTPNGSNGNTGFIILESGRTLLEGQRIDLERTDDTYIREFLD